MSPQTTRTQGEGWGPPPHEGPRYPEPYVRHPLEAACCAMIETLTVKARGSEPYHAAMLGQAAAAITKELRKAGAFGVPIVKSVER